MFPKPILRYRESYTVKYNSFLLLSLLLFKKANKIDSNQTLKYKYMYTKINIIFNDNQIKVKTP